MRAGVLKFKTGPDVGLNQIVRERIPGAGIKEKQPLPGIAPEGIELHDVEIGIIHENAGAAVSVNIVAGDLGLGRVVQENTR